MAESAYLDDRPTSPLRFLVEANLNQIIRRQEQNVDPAEVRSQLNDRIKRIFGGNYFELVPFPGDAWEIPDDVGNGRPRLVVVSYDAVAVNGVIESVPDLIERMFLRKGADASSFRELRNNLIFVVADSEKISEMRRAMVRRIALHELGRPDRLQDLAEHQKDRIREFDGKAEHALAEEIQQCYQHVFYPSRTRLPRTDVDLDHVALSVHQASDSPGAGQTQVLRTLRDHKKVRTREDEPDAPAYIRDRTPLRRGQITTPALREEFRKDPAFPMLLHDDVFVRAIRNGVNSSEYVYQSGDLLYGPGDPAAEIHTDENSIVFTMAYATEHQIWPRRAPETPPPPGPGPLDPASPGPGPVPPGPKPPGPSPLPPSGVWTDVVEAVLKQALITLWEKARKAKVEKIGKLSIRIFDAGDAFMLTGAISSVSGATKIVKMDGGYETKDGAEMSIDFTGPVGDALPVKDFLNAQMKAAKTRNLNSDFTIIFNDGLAMAGDAPEKLTERLTKFAAGTAYVSATAEAKS